MYRECYHIAGETLEPKTFDRRSHRRLTLLVPNVTKTHMFYKINPVHMGSARILPCKYSHDTKLAYHFSGEAIAEKIRYARLMSGLSQFQLAEKVDINRVTLLRLEGGFVSEENMKTDLHVNIALACGLERTYCCNPYHTFLANDSGNQIRAYRKSHHLTQEQLAQLLNVHKKTISGWEKNKQKPGIDKLKFLFPYIFIE